MIATGIAAGVEMGIGTAIMIGIETGACSCLHALTYIQERIRITAHTAATADMATGLTATTNRKATVTD